MRHALVFSLVLHVFILLIKIPETKTKPPQKKKPTPIAVILKEKPPKKNPDAYAQDGETLALLADIMEKIDTQMQTMRDQDKENARAEAFVDKILGRCGDKYVGIGIHYDQFLTQQISHVGPGTPADKAGFRVGDVFIDPTQRIRNQYPIGTRITVPILRGSIIMDIDVTVDEICSL